MQTQHSHTGTDSFIFSVILVVNNSGPRLNTTFDMIARQTIGFHSHVQIVAVDTGSSEVAQDLLQKWAQNYPDNITYLDMPYASIPSARNRGIAEARGEWLTFFDADTLISTNYFQEFCYFLENSNYKGPILCGNWLRYDEAGGNITGQHERSINCRTSGIVDVKQTPECFISSSAACLFRASFVQDQAVQFGERVPASFCGAHFANLLLLAEGSFSVGVVQEAHYLQSYQGMRTRQEQEVWSDPAHYREQLMFGYLDLVQRYQRSVGTVPDFVQNLIISEMRDYMLRMLGNTIPCELSTQQLNDFFELTRLVLRHVEARRILLYAIPNLDLKTRIAILGAFAGNRFSGMSFVIKEISPEGKEALLIHWSTHESKYILQRGSEPEPITWDKQHRITFNDITLCHEYKCWIPLTDNVSRMMNVDGENISVLCKEALLESLERTEVLQKYYTPTSQCPSRLRDFLEIASNEPPEQFRNAWILMDRVGKADDNAEHLCRWIMREHPDQLVYFVIDRKSRDWLRLQKDGLPLLSYGSIEHLQALSGAQWLISSHVDKPVTDPMQTRDDFGKPSYKIAFLQHGIIKYDLSNWLNEFSINCFVTSAKLEYESMLEGQYKFTQRELTLSGLPRHDTLLRKSGSGKKGKIILVCPTWREPLMRTGIQGMSTDEKYFFFKKSDFFKAWDKITSSPTIAKLAGEHKSRVIFLPHPETAPFIHLFRMSERCTAMSWSEVKSVQDLLVASAMVITDYSSLVFDAAYINKPVAYYQFPEYPDFNEGQSRDKNYYDDTKHGFGPVVSSAEEIKNWIAETLHNNCIPQDIYTKRAEDFFTLRDGENCRRVYEAILSRT